MSESIHCEFCNTPTPEHELERWLVYPDPQLSRDRHEEILCHKCGEMLYLSGEGEYVGMYS
jgi:hypothetical protein